MDTTLRDELIQAGKCICCIDRPSLRTSNYCEHCDRVLIRINSTQATDTFAEVRRGRMTKRKAS